MQVYRLKSKVINNIPIRNSMNKNKTNVAKTILKKCSFSNGS